MYILKICDSCHQTLVPPSRMLLTSFFLVLSSQLRAEASDKKTELTWQQVRVDHMNSVDSFCIYSRGEEIVGFGLHRTYGDINLLKVVEDQSDRFEFNQSYNSQGQALSSDSFDNFTYSVVDTDSLFQKRGDGVGKVSRRVRKESSGLSFAHDDLWGFTWNGLINILGIVPRLNGIDEINPTDCDPSNKI